MLSPRCNPNLCQMVNRSLTVLLRVGMINFSDQICTSVIREEKDTQEQFGGQLDSLKDEGKMVVK